MHIARASLVIAALVTACAAPRHAVPLVEAPAPPPLPEAHVEAPAPRVATPPNPFACLPHVRIDASEHHTRDPRSADVAALARGAAVIPRMKALIADAGLPPSLALLPAIESGFRSDVRGRAGERGLWQLRPRTARRFGLVVTTRRDDRLAVDSATRAAARYLGLLHDRYGNWPLALAAYNAGGTRVDRGLARRPRATFWQLADADLLPRGTQAFVPRFFALARRDSACSGPALVSRAR